MMDRLRSLPTWLRLLLAATPVLMCIPIACILVFASQQFSSIRSGTATGQAVGTQQADASTELAAQELGKVLTSTAAAANATEQVNLGITATFLFDQSLNLTLTAQVTPTFTASPILPTETATPILFTSTPRLLTVTLRECRGDEGTVIFGSAQAQSINAFKTLTFRVPPGRYNLQIFWLRKPENNVSSQVDVRVDQVIPFGTDCR